MSSRRLFQKADRNRARPSAASSSNQQQQNHGPAELPEYEPPSCPLDDGARRALTELSNNVDTRNYDTMITQSLKMFGESVSSVNDRYRERKTKLKDRQTKRRQKDVGAEEKTDDERALEKAVAAMREVVPELTAKSELAVREVIDWQVELQDVREAMKETNRKVGNESANAAARDQREQRQQRQDDDDGEEDEEMEDEPDEPAHITGTLHILEGEKQRLADEYKSKTLYERYGLNNDYVTFKKLLHDSTQGDEGQPLPDATRWFKDGGDDSAADEEEDDLIFEREVLDLRCPLSMALFTEPYTSRVCKHTYEKEAIYEFLKNKTVICPQTGCDKMVSKADLYPDEIMARKIKRAKASHDNADVDDDEDGADETDVDGDVSMRVTQQRHIKSERGARGRRRVEEIEDDEEADEVELDEEEEENE